MSSVDKIKWAMSLRDPQYEALQYFDAISSKIEYRTSSKAEAEKIASENCQAPHTISVDKEFDFPSFCFDMTTGIGKSRLMGACIYYLYKTKGYKHFFILAPGNTIYDKMRREAVPGHPKYMFKGLEAEMGRPKVYDGENYLSYPVRYIQEEMVVEKTSDIQIFIFNISKIFTRGDIEFKFHKFNENLGGSFADVLRSFDDLVICMDEAHRYYAPASKKAINYLNPVLGLEYTATPKSTNKNIIYHYGLEDGAGKFLKIPVVMGRTNTAGYSDDDIEEMKLKDGIKLHERRKSIVYKYCIDNQLEQVKPIVLIACKDTTHARKIKEKIDSDAFFGGRYVGKVIEIDSSTSGAETEENIQKLLTIEKNTNPIEIVLHVYKLKEGWDAKQEFIKKVEELKKVAISVPKIGISYSSTITFKSFTVKRNIMDFDVAASRIERYDAVNGKLLQVLDADALIVENPENMLAVSLLESIPEFSSDDAEFILDVVDQYLALIEGTDEEKKKIVRRYATVIVEDLRKQIYASKEESTEFVFNVQKDLIVFKSFAKNMKENGRLNFKKEVPDKKNIKQYLFEGYKKSYYAENAFDSDDERRLSVVLEEDSEVIRFIKPPLNQLGLFYKAAKQYNPDFLVETADKKYMIEVKAANQTDNSEYIQATSRVGRQHPGIIFTVYNPYRPRDLSNYENFVGFHSQMYRYVEGTTATPFAARARDRVLHALVVSLLRLQVETMADNGGASNINDISDEQIKDIKDKILERVKITAPSSYVDTEKEMDEFINTWKNIAKDEKLYYFVPAVADDKKRLLTYYGEYYGDKEKPTLSSMRDVEQSSTVFYWEGV